MVSKSCTSCAEIKKTDRLMNTNGRTENESATFESALSKVKERSARSHRGRELLVAHEKANTKMCM